MCHHIVTRSSIYYGPLVATFKSGIAYTVKRVRDGHLDNLYWFYSALYEEEIDGVWYSSVYAGLKCYDPELRTYGYHLTTLSSAKLMLFSQHTHIKTTAIMKVKVLGFRSYGWTDDNQPSLYCHRYRPLEIFTEATLTKDYGVPVSPFPQ